MTHHRDPLRFMYLAGTVPIPSPFPEVGIITLTSFQSADAGSRSGRDVVRIEHVQSPRLVITRSVLVEEVEVVFLPENPTSPDPTRGKWFVGPAERVRWIDELNRTGHSQVRGIVYVRENARVLMLVELGMTAAESAEYYPPITRERTDAHYDLHAASGQPVKRSAIGPLDCTDPMRDCTYRVRDCTSI